MRISASTENCMNGHLKSFVFTEPSRWLSKLCLPAILSLMYILIGCQNPNDQSVPESSFLEAQLEIETATIPIVDSPIDIYPPFSFDFDPKNFVWVGMGGYAFESIPGYMVEANVTQARASDPTGRILITLNGSSMQQAEPIESVLISFEEVMTASFLDLEVTQPAPIFIQGYEGLSVDIQGKLSTKDFTGRVIIVSPSTRNYFMAQAIGFQIDGVDSWLADGDENFEAIISSIQFFEPTDSACMIASSDDYGYNPDNPIQVWEGSETYPDVQEAYLDNLRGPNFENVSYRLLRSPDSQYGKLQVYELNHLGLNFPVQLYLGNSSYQFPRAPKGFKCPEPFSLPIP